MKGSADPPVSVKNRPPYERPGIGPLLLLGGETEFRETGSNEDVEPREALLHVRDMHPVAVVLGEYLGEEGP